MFFEVTSLASEALGMCACISQSSTELDFSLFAVGAPNTLQML
jgi:hypothetical protein